MSVASSSDARSVPPAKRDPEALVLRGRPRPVVRFRRGLIIGVVAVVASGTVALSWFALAPPSFRSVAAVEGRDPFAKATPEGLEKAPADYGAVPRLGPPLPGDLGRPILEHRRAMDAAASADNPEALERERARAALEDEHRRAVEALRAARSSALLVTLARGDGASDAAGVSGQTGPADPGQDAPGDPNRLLPAPSPWTLSAGTVIPASLITGLNSDLPGIVVAQVTEPVRDSATGAAILIPQGARLIGRYESSLSYGQRRAMLVWERLVLPDASSIVLGKVPGADRGGYSGLSDRVDFHTDRLLGGVALSTVLGIVTELGLGGGSELVEAVRESGQQATARAGDEITRRNLDVRPTVTIRPGFPVRAILHEDLVLRPWKG